ncbi:MAG: hypothetical protein QXX51_05605 [Candidatus Bathyarchaeia archaeon]
MEDEVVLREQRKIERALIVVCFLESSFIGYVLARFLLHFI